MTLKELRAIVDSIEQADDAQVILRFNDTLGAPTECGVSEILLENALTHATRQPQRIIFVAG